MAKLQRLLLLIKLTQKIEVIISFFDHNYKLKLT